MGSNPNSEVYEVVIPKTLRLDTQLGLRDAYLRIPFSIRKHYLGSYHLVHERLLDDGTRIAAIKVNAAR
jgi:hypothetical protein